MQQEKKKIKRWQLSVRTKISNLQSYCLMQHESSSENLLDCYIVGLFFVTSEMWDCKVISRLVKAFIFHTCKLLEVVVCSLPLI